MIPKRIETRFGKLMVRDRNQLKTAIENRTMKPRKSKRYKMFDKFKDDCHNNL